MTAMAQNTDEGAVFEWPGVDRYRMREAAVNCTTRWVRPSNKEGVA
jgi:hypothetical protein